MAQWITIGLPMQETWVQSLVQEDPTCLSATKPVSHSYSLHSYTLEPTHCNYRSLPTYGPCSTTGKATAVGSPLTARRSSPNSAQLEEACEGESCSVVCDSSRPRGPYSPWNSPDQNTGVGSLSLLQGIKPRSPTLQADSLPAEPPGKPKRERLHSNKDPVKPK